MTYGPTSVCVLTCIPTFVLPSKISWHSIWQEIRVYEFYLAKLLASYLPFLLALYLASLLALYLAYALAFYSTNTLALNLAYILTFDILCGINSDLIWPGPAVPTLIWIWPFRSGSAHCDRELAVEVQQCPL